MYKDYVKKYLKETCEFEYKVKKGKECVWVYDLEFRKNMICISDLECGVWGVNCLLNSFKTIHYMYKYN